MSAANDRLHELVERIEPSRADEATRLLETMIAEKPAGENGTAKRLPHRHEEAEWVRTHHDELAKHRGKWVLVEGSQLLAVDDDHDKVWLKAKEAGIKVPLIFRAPSDDLPFAGV
jgi:hypothetical protein